MVPVKNALLYKHGEYKCYPLYVFVVVKDDRALCYGMLSDKLFCIQIQMKLLGKDLCLCTNLWLHVFRAIEPPGF